MDDNDVKIDKNRRLLKEVLKEKEPDVNKQSGSGVSSGYAESRNNGNRQNEGAAKSSNPRVESREGGTAQVGGTPPGVREGIRQTDRPRIYPDKSTDTRSGRGEKTVKFELKSPFKKGEPAKLFTKDEIELQYDKMFDIYFRGSGLLDDILEICVKGHEPVQIWQLDEEEAETLAKMHLSRATHDKRAAASARQLLALYDRLYFWLLVGPRAKMTYTHVREHGGLSFR